MNLIVTVADTGTRSKCVLIVRDDQGVIECHNVRRVDLVDARTKLLEQLSEREGVDSVYSPPL